MEDSFLRVSQFPTRLEIKTAVQAELSHELNIDVALQELVDRSYEAGVAPNSRREVEFDFSVARTTWSGYEVILVDPVLYDGLAGVRDNEKPQSKKHWKVVDVDVEHQEPGATSDKFVDHHTQDVNGTNYRIYQVPNCLDDSDDVFRFMMKLHGPTIALDTDFVPVKSIYLAKLGLLAIGYENDADPRAESAWQRFYAESGMSQKRNDGLKQRFIKVDHGLRRKPTNFM